ncbi:MAG: hypothetical protein GY913_00850 [Proteobacteria bacterium]|nr:hypothetical protein [Pseudomonadota bacterium]
MSLRNLGLRGDGAAGAEWGALVSIDWSTIGAADLTAGGTVAAGGLTWTAENGGKCSTLGPDGSTGLRFVQTSNSGIVAGTCPAIHTPLSAIPGAIAVNDELYVMLRFTLSANSGRVGVTLRNGTDYLFGGTVWVSVAHEVDALAAADEYTDYSSALGGTADRVLGFRYHGGRIAVHNHGAWSGSWPTGPAGAPVAVMGEEATNGKTATRIPLVGGATTLGIMTLRSTTPNVDDTVIGTRILRRTAA